jgi:hypothetical protein
MQAKMLEMLAADREAEQRNLPAGRTRSRPVGRLVTWCRDRTGVLLVRAGSRVVVTSRARIHAAGLTVAHLDPGDR